MERPTILFVSHAQQQCGVYQFGVNVAGVLAGSERYRFVYQEARDAEHLRMAVQAARPAAIIYNHHPATLPWMERQVVRRLKVPQAGILHEVTQRVAHFANNSLFDYHIAPDPTLQPDNPLVFKTGRLLPHYVNHQPVPKITTVGCFGFGTKGKGFDKVVRRVHEEYDRAIIRLHMPVATFADAQASGVVAAEEACRALITKPGVELRITHEFLSMPQLLDFLAGNTINAFFYDEQEGRGISSVVDHSLAVGRPLAINRCSMFRHVLAARPSICIEDSSLREIIAHGDAPLRPFREAWTDANLIRDYERIVDHMLARPPSVIARGWCDKSFNWPVRKFRGALRRGRKLVAVASGRPLPFS